MQTITRNVLGRFGCLGCHSGIDIRFVVEENFAVDENLNLTAVPFAVGGSDGELTGQANFAIGLPVSVSIRFPLRIA